jgi:hypothetical protein
MLVASVAIGREPIGSDVLRSPDTVMPPYTFATADERLLDEIQYASFQYFWKEVGSPACLARDTRKNPIASIAAVGFQLASLPIAVERGWISRSDAAARAQTVLRALLDRDDNKKHGIYLHFPDMNTAGPSATSWTSEASTVDSALLFAGAMVAGQYFDDEVAKLSDRMLAEANWKAFAVANEGRLSMGWNPEKKDDLKGGGEFIKADWHDASDEERLIYFIAAGAPNPEFAIEPVQYYKLDRPLKRHGDMPPFVVSWPGSLFTYFFAHCYINYAALGADDPGQFGVAAPRVDWFENSRRAVLTHRQRCIEAAGQFKTFAADRWGLSPCSAKAGYIVPSTRPNKADQDEWHEGTIAPYAAASSIMFCPQESLAALRAFRGLKDSGGQPLIWRDPQTGGYGFVDSFNLDQQYASDDYVGIDQGPMLLAIENARTGLVWRLFMEHPVSQRAAARLKLGP